jgi:S-adenosylmethionine:tRNA ribosyltransferase-isomerase
LNLSRAETVYNTNLGEFLVLLGLDQYTETVLEGELEIARIEADPEQLIQDHLVKRPDEETYVITEETASRIEKTRAEGRKVIAVGTTSIRTLESAWKNGGLVRGEGVTSIFIYPGYTFQAVDGLFTNFHTPRSTLLMLVAAFAEAGPGVSAGRDFILESYASAVREGYRFFSYGDAMLIL